MVGHIYLLENIKILFCDICNVSCLRFRVQCAAYSSHTHLPVQHYLWLLSAIAHLSVSAQDDVVLKDEIFTFWPFTAIVLLVRHGSTRLQYLLRQQELGVRGQCGLCSFIG